MPQKHPNMIVAADADALMLVAAERMVACLRRSSARLTGGSAPERRYEVPATEPCRYAFHWNHTHRFRNDDRFVSHDGPRGNFGMAQRQRFHCVPAPSGNIRAIPTGVENAEEPARLYETKLRDPQGKPYAHLVLTNASGAPAALGHKREKAAPERRDVALRPALRHDGVG